MDAGKKSQIQTGLAFLIGMTLGAGALYLHHESKVKTIKTDIETTVTKIVPDKQGQFGQVTTAQGDSQSKKPLNSTQSGKPTAIALVPAVPIGRSEPALSPPIALESSVKQLDYDKPSYFSSWISTGAPAKAVLICVHGFGLYSEAFEDLGRRLCRKGYPTFSVDARGFGHYIKTNKTLDFDASVSDIGQLIKLIKAKYPNVPIVLIGESMGGAIAIQSGALYQKDISGIIASAPGDVRYKQGKMDLKVAPRLLLRPNKRVEWGDELLQMATSNSRLWHKWKNDPLVRLELAPKELLKFQSFMGKTGSSAKQIVSLPVLFLHGGDDELMKRKGTVELFNDVPSSRKDLFILGQREHVMLEEGQFDDKTIRLVETWLGNSFSVPIRVRVN